MIIMTDVLPRLSAVREKYHALTKFHHPVTEPQCPTDTSAPPSLTAPLADPALGLPAQQTLLAGLVSHRLNRHGLGLLVTDNLAHAWRYRFTTGADYDFVLSSAGWNTALALSFFPRKSLELTAEAGYSSSATSSNAGSAATLLNFFIRTYY